MARFETKSISVAPEKEQEAVEKHALFGWQMISSQEVYNQNSHLERRGDEIWNVTNTTNYVKLVFQRELDMENLGQIKTLEKEYWHAYEMASHHPVAPSWKFRIGLPVVCAVPGILTSNVILMFAGLILGIAVVVCNKKFIYKPRVSKWADWANKRDELEEKTKRIAAGV